MSICISCGFKERQMIACQYNKTKKLRGVTKSSSLMPVAKHGCLGVERSVVGVWM